MPSLYQSVQELRFDNRFTRLLPADPELRNYRRQVKGACYSRVMPTPVGGAQAVIFLTGSCAIARSG